MLCKVNKIPPGNAMVVEKVGFFEFRNNIISFTAHQS